MPTTNERRRVSARIKRLVMKMAGGRCAQCGATWEGGTQMDIDHKRPLAQGGRNTIDNLQLLCSPCNQRKGTTWDS